MISVSAVIPTYNGTRYLLDAVQSAMAQTYELLEIIVVDDGSPEGIETLLSPFFPKVRYVRQENAGPAAARNLGISVAKGDLIAFLDDDDLWHPQKTAEQVRRMMENPGCALVYSYQELIDEEGRVIPNEAPAGFPSGSVYRDFLKRNRIGTASVAMVRREALEVVGLFDENREYLCGEDYDLWLRIARNYEVIFCPGNLACYRVRNAGISQNLDNALKGDLYVLRKAVFLHEKDPKLPDAEFYAAVDAYMHHTTRKFAYLNYYMRNERTEARRLLMTALRLRPCNLKDLCYLVVFSMPDFLFRFLRRTKQRLSAAVYHSS